MYLLKDISELPETNRPIVLAMGCFDGVHVGHQKVISTAVDQAATRHGEAWVYTFRPHPAKLLVPEKSPPLISAEPCRLRQFAALGVKGVIEMPFTLEFSQRSPAAFLSELHRKAPHLSGIVCGQDWSFGYRASGTFQTLAALGKQHGFTATAVAPVMDGERKISSTTIRNAVRQGDIPTAEQLLGRPVSLFGTVIHGNEIGRELGYRTANIDPLNELLPGPGVYAAYTLLGTPPPAGQRPPAPDERPSIASAVFIGKRETFGCHTHVIESHLLDFNRDLYDQAVEVVLVQKMREIEPFPSKDALIKQIGMDIGQIRKLLSA